MSRKVSIVLELDSDEQSHFFEKYIRNMFPVGVISYSNLPDTSKLYEENTTFKKLVKGVKTAQKLRDDFIHANN